MNISKRVFIEDHGDPGPTDVQIEDMDRTEAENNEPSLTAGERQR